MAAGNKKLIIGVVSLVFLVAAAAVGGTIAFVKSSSPPAEGDEVAEKQVKPAIYRSIEPPLLVNFAEARGPRFLQLGIQVMMRDHKMIDVLDTNMPVIRNNLILLLSDQDPDVLRTREGKEVLNAEVLEVLRASIEDEIPESEEGEDPMNVEAVYFTNFVMQ